MSENSEQFSFLCGAPGCKTFVSGVYCDRHKQQLIEQLAPSHGFCPGELVQFEYRGAIKPGIIEKVMRSRVTVLIEVNYGRKTKLVTVDASALTRRPKHAA